MEHEGLTVAQLQEQLCRNGGLAGVSGLTGVNLPAILREAAKGNVRCQDAIDLWTYDIRKMIGAYTAAWGGLDVLTFTGGIGEHERRIR